MCKAWATGALFVIATDKRFLALEELVSVRTGRWAQANQVHVHVTQPLWEDEEGDW